MMDMWEYGGLVMAICLIVVLVATPLIYFTSKSNQVLYEKLTGEKISIITAANLPDNFFTQVNVKLKIDKGGRTDACQQRR